MHGSRRKIPSKNLVRQRCAEGFHSGVKGLTADSGMLVPKTYFHYLLTIYLLCSVWSDDILMCDMWSVASVNYGMRIRL
jgi:hypothetical protein